MNQHPVKHFQFDEPWINERSIKQMLAGGTASIPLLYWLSIDCNFLPRVITLLNDRLPITLEELTAAHDFNKRVRSIIN